MNWAFFYHGQTIISFYHSKQKEFFRWLNRFQCQLLYKNLLLLNLFACYFIPRTQTSRKWFFYGCLPTPICLKNIQKKAWKMCQTLLAGKKNKLLSRQIKRIDWRDWQWVFLVFSYFKLFKEKGKKLERHMFYKLNTVTALQISHHHHYSHAPCNEGPFAT